MVHYKLHYFDVYARGETARQMFVLAGVPFEDRRISFEEWPKIKDGYPYVFGQVPVLEIDGKPLAQSNAIYRFIGKKYVFLLFSVAWHYSPSFFAFNKLNTRFSGNSNFERVLVDSIADQFQDFYDEIRPFFAVACGVWEGDKVELQRTVMEPTRDKMLTIMTKFIEENESKSGYLVGNSLTFADLLLFNHVLVYEGFVKGYADGFPKICALRDKIREIPAMKEYLEKRPYSIR